MISNTIRVNDDPKAHPDHVAYDSCHCVDSCGFGVCIQEAPWDARQVYHNQGSVLDGGEAGEALDIFDTAMENNFKVGDIVIKSILDGTL